MSTAIFNPQGLIERLNREGEPFTGGAGQSSTFTSFAAPTGAGTVFNVGLPTIPVGRSVFIQEVNLYSTTPITGRLQTGGQGWGGSIGTTVRMDPTFACGPNFSTKIVLNQFIRSSMKPDVIGYITKWLDAAVSGTHYVLGGSTGYSLADSTNFDAQKVHLFLGDSIWNGTGPTSVDTCIPYLINQYYQNKGIDCRYILKAYSGSRSDGHERKRASGDYNFPQVDVIHYNLGMNDAGVLTTNQSMANVTAMITWALARYPGVKIIIYGPTPRQDANESALVALRSAESSYIAGLNNPNVKFCDLGNSFDRTVFANYVSTDTSGSAVHPGDTGLNLEWNGGYNGNIGIKAWLDANLPTI